MRIAHSVLVTLLVASAVPSVCFAQIVVPYHTPGAPVDHLDTAVPVATVTRPGDAIALADPRQGDGFVLGAATLNLTSRDRATIVFTMANASQSPIPFSAIDLDIRTVNVRPDTGEVVVSCGRNGLRLSGYAPKGDVALRAGETISVELPIGPKCGADQGPARGYLVSIRSDDTYSFDSPQDARATYALLQRAFEQLRSQSQQPVARSSGDVRQPNQVIDD